MKINIDYNEATTLIALCSVTIDNMNQNKSTENSVLFNQTLSDLENIALKTKESLRRLGKCEDADNAVVE